MSVAIAITCPRRVPIYYVTGYPKSGTVWATQMVADYLKLPFVDLSYTPVGCPAVLHGHYRVRQNRLKMIYVLRDGRDAMISMFYYLARQLGPGQNPHVPRHLRKYLGGIPNREAIREYMPQFITQQFQRPAGCKLNWRNHVNSFYENARPGVALIKYEGLLNNPRNELINAFHMLGADSIDEEALGWTIQKFSFERQTGRPRGSASNESFVRKGTSGQWREVFTPEAARIFNEFAGDTLIQTGYEPNHDWVNEIT